MEKSSADRGTKLLIENVPVVSAFAGKAENICSIRALRVLTQTGLQSLSLAWRLRSDTLTF